jgi:hypothetical protein
VMNIKSIWQSMLVVFLLAIAALVVACTPAPNQIAPAAAAPEPDAAGLTNDPPAAPGPSYAVSPSQQLIQASIDRALAEMQVATAAQSPSVGNAYSIRQAAVLQAIENGLADRQAEAATHGLRYAVSPAQAIIQASVDDAFSIGQPDVLESIENGLAQQHVSAGTAAPRQMAPSAQQIIEDEIRAGLLERQESSTDVAAGTPAPSHTAPSVEQIIEDEVRMGLQERQESLSVGFVYSVGQPAILEAIENGLAQRGAGTDAR